MTSPTRMMRSMPNSSLIFIISFGTDVCILRFYFELKTLRFRVPPNWLLCYWRIWQGGGGAGEEVGGEGWLVGQQTEAATSPQWLSVLAAGYTGLKAVLTAAKCRSMLALNGLWWTSMWALITMDTQRLPWATERPWGLKLHNNHLWYEFYLVVHKNKPIS